MGLDALLARMERRTATPVTAQARGDVTPEPASIQGCTPVTSVTPEIGIDDDAGREPFDIEAFEECAAIAEFDGSRERVNRTIARLESDPALTYALETHDEIDPDAVILTVAIRGKGAGELRIPKSRYDALALMELIERHTTRADLH